MTEAAKEVRKTLESGAALVVQMGSWEESHRLYKAVMAVVERTSFAEDDVIKLLARLSISGDVEVMVLNLGPFLKNLTSLFSEIRSLKNTTSQK